MGSAKKAVESVLKKMRNGNFIVEVQKEEENLGSEFVSFFVEEMNKVPPTLSQDRKIKAAKAILKKRMLKLDADKKEKEEKLKLSGGNEGGKKRGGRGKKFYKH